jgi:hypothetical protein
MAKEKENLLYWSIFFIAAVAVLFFAGGKFFSKEEPPAYESIKYGVWNFTKVDNLWWFQWQKEDRLYTAGLRFNPYDVEEVAVRGRLDTAKFNARNYVYITFDFSNKSSQNLTALALAATELTQNIATAINRTPIAACASEGDDACIDRPIKTCENTDEPVIFLNEGGEPALVMNGACIMLTGEGMNIVRSVDRLLYHWYRIM